MRDKTSRAMLLKKRRVNVYLIVAKIYAQNFVSLIPDGDLFSEGKEGEKMSLERNIQEFQVDHALFLFKNLEQIQ